MPLMKTETIALKVLRLCDEYGRSIALYKTNDNCVTRAWENQPPPPGEFIGMYNHTCDPEWIEADLDALFDGANTLMLRPANSNFLKAVA